MEKTEEDHKASPGLEEALVQHLQQLDDTTNNRDEDSNNDDEDFQDSRDDNHQSTQSTAVNTPPGGFPDLQIPANGKESDLPNKSKSKKQNKKKKQKQKKNQQVQQELQQVEQKPVTTDQGTEESDTAQDQQSTQNLDEVQEQQSGVEAPEQPNERVLPGSLEKENITQTNLDSPTSVQLPPRNRISTIVNLGLPEETSVPENIPSLLLAAKQNDISIKFDSKDASQRSAIELGVESIKKIFNQIKSTIGLAPELLGGVEIDWNFWGRVVDNYDELVKEEPHSVQRAVADGIPMEIRGIIWQLVSRSKNLQLEELYLHLKLETSAHERAIKRDLTRTSFFTNVNNANKADELFNVIKAYSLFDPDVGYTQGMVFIAVPLVMNMNEAECFSLFVTLMKEYGLRDLFCPDMEGLHLLLHQFDCLLEKNLPLLYNHLVSQGVRLLMYASQWFLTFFSYKFPLDIVLRIFDMVITQGIEAILRLAVNLMLRNEESLLSLHFDKLLEFLKLNLFNIYVSDEFIKQPEKSENKRFSLLGRKPKTTTNYYKLNAFVKDALLIEIMPADLNRYKQEFKILCGVDKARVKEIEDLREENGRLRHEVKKLEMAFLEINRDHIHVGLELVDTKVLLPELLGDIEELQSQIHSLQGEIKELEAKVDEGNTDIPQGVESQIQELLAENAKETERFATLEEKFSELSLKNEKLDHELKQRGGGKKWFWG